MSIDVAIFQINEAVIAELVIRPRRRLRCVSVSMTRISSRKFDAKEPGAIGKHRFTAATALLWNVRRKPFDLKAIDRGVLLHSQRDGFAKIWLVSQRVSGLDFSRSIRGKICRIPRHVRNRQGLLLVRR